MCPAHTVVDDQTTAAQRSEVMVRALLLLSEAELLRWQPRKALDNAEAALVRGAGGRECGGYLAVWGRVGKSMRGHDMHVGTREGGCVI